MLQNILLVLSLCIDTFVASISYGTNNIKIPLKSNILMNLICSITLFVSLFFGSMVSSFIPKGLTSILSCILLLGLGVYRVFEYLFKGYLLKKSTLISPLTFKIFDFNFVLRVYADEKIADFDNSKVLTLKEASYLAIALSLDSLAVGFSYSLISINYLSTILMCFIFGAFCIYVGMHLGKKLLLKTNLNLSWLSGAILIIIALMKVI